jgi:hypothetical protein
MVDVAVVTLAIVFPHELPVRCDLIIHDFGDLRPSDPLGLERGSKDSLRLLKGRRFRSETDINESLDFARVNRMLDQTAFCPDHPACRDKPAAFHHFRRSTGDKDKPNAPA